MTPAAEAPSLAPLDDRRGQLILAAALGVFKDRGFAEARMADVAARTGASVETLLVRFGDKEALLVQVLEWVCRRHPLAPDAPPNETLGARLDRLMFAISQQAAAPDMLALHRLMLADGWRHPTLVHGYETGVLEPARDRLRALAQRFAERGLIEEGDESAFADACVGWLRADLEPALLGLAEPPDERTGKRRARVIAKRVLRAFSPSPPKARRSAEPSSDQSDAAGDPVSSAL